MKSAVFYGKHDIRVEERLMPPVGSGEVRIQVKACGICGTDVHIFEGDEGAAAVTPPTILGHEFSGVVETIGPGVTSVAVGDRVCIDPNCYCGACEPCRRGEVHYCEHMVGYGTTAQGGFAEYCTVPERQVYRLGENTNFLQGAMAEPVACCLHGLDMCEIRPGHQVVVIGGGMIGLLMMQLARLAGASKVALLEIVQSKRELARKLGADVALDPRQGDVKQALWSAGFSWINTVIECVGRPATMEQALEIADNRAVVMLFGLTAPEDTITLKPFQTVFKKELVLKGSYINPCTQSRALALIDSGRLDVTSMILPPRGLEDLGAILASPALRAQGKFVICPEKE